MAGLTDLINLFDTYSRHARLYPALLVSFPIPIMAIACFPTLVADPSFTTFITLFAGCGGLYLLSNIVRSRGKDVEVKLLKAWGGWPTTEMLRWRGPLDKHTLRRYHSCLQSKLPALHFPDEAAEAAEPEDADSVYASAIRWLKEQCRGAQFPLVEKENAQYGFRRNALGARALAIATSVASLAFGACVLAFRASGFQGSILDISRKTIAYIPSAPLVVVAFVAILVALLWWVWGTNPAWVRQAGRDYAAALLATCDQHTAKVESRGAVAGEAG